MTAMQNFCTWFVQEMPAFFLEEPIIYLFGLILLGYTFKILFSIIGQRRF